MSKSRLEHTARQRPALERILWDTDARVWRWRISTDTPDSPVIRTGSGSTRWEAHQGLTVEWSRLTTARAWGYAVTPQLRVSGRKGGPRRPKLRGPGLA
jgi:hypothetical protein